MSQADIQTIDAIVRWVSGLAAVFAVPLIVVIAFVYLIRAKGAPERIGRLLAPFTSVKVFGQELTFRNSDPVTLSAVETFLGYRDDTRARYRTLVQKHGIAALHRRLVLDHCGAAAQAEGFRSTLHVADILFAESYYQLLPYWPAGGGEARSWSIRYGIVGNTWRHGASRGVGDVVANVDELIDVWGMTRDEAEVAESAAGARSLIAVVLRDSANRIVGIFYADAREPHAFGATEESSNELAKGIAAGATTINLTRALSDMVADLPRSPIIPMLGKVREEVTDSSRRRKTDRAERVANTASHGR